ncbi:succinyl-diaminopimelate desuccinylase [Nesterenkonia sp. AN1]|uniref:Succinyl-diaminopimelate desuccinylase n=1 Tax=Nesterenkonia aurantiaca TaxID=1436010 RepID=A0A4V3EBX9_9MICC|nr:MULTISPECIES: succinyl-diaminopimelate desuccinylase [Nesterenkonia]EXF25858.1 succinyl-diaminopimelate desuccinylase [Nesterenkonia sp. AN1]TDS84182.1 succinyldiaminopimelate desuccinylase [Nesterenkonia aurantiaca]
MDIRALLSGDVAALTEAIIGCESVSGNEKTLADAVEAALQDLPGLSLHRDGDTVIARTETSAAQRIILAGHLDTVPLPSTPGSRGTVPPRWEQAEGAEVLYGRGATDMKGGVAVQLKLAEDVATHLSAGGSLDRDITWVFYDHEEVEASKSGLGRVLSKVPELLDGDFAVLLEPTHGVVEGGCNGTCRFEVTIPGVAAHSGRAWMGENAIHGTAGLLRVLSDYTPKTITVEGLDYREGLNAVRIRGGVAGNVIPDSTVVEINYRFAPDKTVEQAHAHVREVLAEAGISEDQQRVTDSSAAARPGLEHPAAQAFIDAVGGVPMPKYGWTDVARFSARGVPAVNFGPGDPLLAHSDDEHVTAQALRDCHTALHRWLLDG